MSELTKMMVRAKKRCEENVEDFFSMREIIIWGGVSSPSVCLVVHPILSIIIIIWNKFSYWVIFLFIVQQHVV